jgi:hypothetical protein
VPEINLFDILSVRSERVKLYLIAAFLVFLSIIPFPVWAQSKKSAVKTDIKKIYSQAIGDFIRDANQRNKIPFDTLFFGKRDDGDPYNDFPDIELPGMIENTQIRLISPESGKIMQRERKERIYINMIGWVDAQKAEFLFFIFSNGFDHQYNYSIDYKYDSNLKEYKLVKLQFKGPPFDR